MGLIAPFGCRVVVLIKCDRCARREVVLHVPLQHGEMLPEFTLPQGWGRTQHGRYESVYCSDHTIMVKDHTDLVEMQDIARDLNHDEECLVNVAKEIKTLPDPVVCTCKPSPKTQTGWVLPPEVFNNDHSQAEILGRIN